MRASIWVRYELQFCDGTGRVCFAFPCDEKGQVHRDSITHYDKVNLQNCYADKRLHRVVKKEIEYMHYDYRGEKPEEALVGDTLCEFFSIRLDQKTIPDGKFYYEIGHDDVGDPCRIQKGIAVDFFWFVSKRATIIIG